MGSLRTLRFESGLTWKNMDVMLDVIDGKNGDVLQIVRVVLQNPRHLLSVDRRKQRAGAEWRRMRNEERIR